MSTTADRVEKAVAAFEAGEETLASLEGFIGTLLRTEPVTPADASSALRGAIARRTIPPDFLRRLRLTDSAETPAVEQVATRSAAADSAHDVAKTKFRPAQVATPAVAPISSDRPGTGSTWADTGVTRPRAAIAVGKRLGGRYLLERVLGEGGMGVVYFASDEEVEGECFAIKVLKPAIREYPEALDLLREEVRRTRALGHPNIVGVYSLNTDLTNVYMIMEYLEGKTLSELIDESFGRGMPFMRAWPLIHDMCAALAYAHDQNVIHSDIKTSNVFVTTGGRAKLLDFGIARAARGRRNRANTAGLGALTPMYASCEMLEGHTPDARDDIYSLACVIFEMLSGRHPFSNHTAIEARDHKRIPPPLESLSPGQNAAIARALAFDREERTASVESLLAGLSPAASGGTAAAAGARSTPSRKRFYLICSGLLAVGVVAAAIFVAWYRFSTVSDQEKVIAVQAQTAVSQLTIRIEAGRRKTEDMVRDARLSIDRLTDRLNLARNTAEQELLRKQLTDAQAAADSAQAVSAIAEKGVFSVEALAAFRDKQRSGELALQAGRVDEAAQTLAEARRMGEAVLTAADSLPAAVADQRDLVARMDRARTIIESGQGDADAALANTRATIDQATQLLSRGDAVGARGLFATSTENINLDVQAFLDRVIASLGAIAQRKMAANDLDVAQEAITRAESLQKLKAEFH